MSSRESTQLTDINLIQGPTTSPTAAPPRPSADRRNQRNPQQFGMPLGEGTKAPPPGRGSSHSAAPPSSATSGLLDATTAPVVVLRASSWNRHRTEPSSLHRQPGTRSISSAGASPTALRQSAAAGRPRSRSPPQLRHALQIRAQDRRYPQAVRANLAAPRWRERAECFPSHLWQRRAPIVVRLIRLRQRAHLHLSAEVPVNPGASTNETRSTGTAPEP